MPRFLTCSELSQTQLVDVVSVTVICTITHCSVCQLIIIRAVNFSQALLLFQQLVDKEFVICSTLGTCLPKRLN